MSGYVSECPGYFAVIINDRTEEEELFRYDILVPCPPFFNVSFLFPVQGGRRDKCFEVVFDDSKEEFRVTMRYFASEDHEYVSESKENWGPNTFWSFLVQVLCFAVVLATTIAFLVQMFLILSAIYANDSVFSKRKKHMKAKDSLKHGYLRSVNALRFCLGSYCIFKLIFSILVTFLTLYTLSLTCLHQAIERVSDFHKIDLTYANSSERLYLTAETYSSVGMQRLTELLHSRSFACSAYTGHVFETFFARLKNSSYTKEGRFMTNIIIDDMESVLHHHRNIVMKAWSDHRSAILKALRPHFKRHRKYIERVRTSNWFLFPRSLLVDNSVEDGPSVVRNDIHENHVGAALEGGAANFDRFFLHPKVEDFQRWEEDFLLRYIS